MRPPRPLPALALARVALVALAVIAAPSPRTAAADGPLPGEATELTPEVRATAEKKVQEIVKETPEAEKAQRALLVLGPVVWPVVEMALKLTPPDAARGRLTYLKALLSKKAEPEFEFLRERLRRKVLGGLLADVPSELVAFRVGRPDPKDPKKKIPPTVKPTMVGTASVYRSGDGSIVIAFGADGTVEQPNAGPVTLVEPTAGFVVAMGGRPVPHERHSGNGSDVLVKATIGFAYAWATNGADGTRGGGEGGVAGSAEAVGGAGQYAHPGNGGAGGPP